MEKVFDKEYMTQYTPEKNTYNQLESVLLL